MSPRRSRLVSLRQIAPDGPAAEHESFGEPEVREHEHAQSVVADDARGRTDAAGVAEGLHADAGADLALADRPGGGGVERACDERVVGLRPRAHVAPLGRVALADDGDDHVVAADARLARGQRVRHAGVHCTDVGRARQQDRAPPGSPIPRSRACPVSSPAPFSAAVAQKYQSLHGSPPCGHTAVTPV